MILFKLQKVEFLQKSENEEESFCENQISAALGLTGSVKQCATLLTLALAQFPFLLILITITILVTITTTLSVHAAHIWFR